MPCSRHPQPQNSRDSSGGVQETGSSSPDHDRSTAAACPRLANHSYHKVKQLFGKRMRPHCWAAPKHTHKACQLRGAAARPGGTQTHADIRRLQASSVTVWPQQAAAVDAPPLELCRRSQLLAEWVEEAGGYVHPSLAVVLTTRDCGCRWGDSNGRSFQQDGKGVVEASWC